MSSQCHLRKKKIKQMQKAESRKIWQDKKPIIIIYDDKKLYGILRLSNLIPVPIIACRKLPSVQKEHYYTIIHNYGAGNTTGNDP